MTEKMISRADVEKLRCDFAEGSFTAEGWNHAIDAVLAIPAVVARETASNARQVDLSFTGERQAPAHAEPVAGTPIAMTYRNYRGEIDQRTVVPTRIWFGSTDWHPEPGWLMAAYDLAKSAHRDFALADCQFANLTHPPTDAAETPEQRERRWSKAFKELDAANAKVAELEAALMTADTNEALELAQGWDDLKESLPSDGHAAAELLFDYGDNLADMLTAQAAHRKRRAG